MQETRDFKTEYRAFMQEYPYSTITVDGISVRYQYGGKEGAPVLLFFHGLEMQEMWMAYAMHFAKDYRFLIYEYPMHTVDVDAQMDFASHLLQQLSISQVILVGASDGGVFAQIFAKRFPKLVQGMLLTTTLTLDSDYLRDIVRQKRSMPIRVAMLKLLPAKTEMKILMKKSPAFLSCESPENQVYGSSFYETVTSDLQYKERFVHSFQSVYMLAFYKHFAPQDFAYLRGRIQILIPEHDIFKKEDQNRLVALFRNLDAEIIDVPGGHVGCIVQPDIYIEKMEQFIKAHVL